MILNCRAHADDASLGVPLSEPRSEPTGSIQVDSSSVSLQGSTVATLLVIRASDTARRLTFIGPTFGWLGEADPYPDRQFPELKVEIDGATIEPRDSFQAYAGTKEITRMIQAAHIDPWSITETPPLAAVDAGHAANIDELEKSGALEKADLGYLAKWTARRVIQIPVKPSSNQHLSLSYSARPAYALLPRDRVFTPARAAAYCVDAKQAAGVMKFPSASARVVATEYVLPAGIDAKSPASVSFTLAEPPPADSNHPPSFTFICAADGSSIAVSGGMTERAVRTDQRGNVRVMTLTEPSSPIR